VRSTHLVKCLVCLRQFGNAAEHSCEFRGVEHAEMHRRETARLLAELRAALLDMDARLRELEKRTRGSE